MKKILLVIFFILGSQWFFPVSCTTATFVGMKVIENKDARIMSRGDTPHSIFYVIVKLPAKNEIAPVLFGELGRFRENNPDVRFFLEKAQGTLEKGLDSWQYSAESQTEEKQVITVLYKGDNARSESVYLVNKNDILPISSKVRTPGHMFAAVPYAIVFGLVILFLFRFLHGALIKSSKSKADWT